MPVFNSGKYLETAINSVLSQTLNEIELFLIDDGSIDGSSELCDNFALKDKRVKVIHQKNAGICKARNVALNMTHGEYIAFIDHDDEYLLDFLEKAYKVAQEVNADIVKLSKKEIIFREQVVVRERYYQLNSQILEKKDIISSIFYWWDIPVQERSILIKSEKIRNGVMWYAAFWMTGFLREPNIKVWK